MAPEAGRGAPRASDGSTLAVVPPIQTTVFVRLQVRSAPGPKRVPKDGTPVWVRCSLPAPVGCAPRVRAAMTLAPGKACKQAVHARHGRGLKLRLTGQEAHTDLEKGDVSAFRSAWLQPSRVDWQ